MVAQIAQFEFVDKVIFVNPVNSPRQTNGKWGFRKDKPSELSTNQFTLKPHSKIRVYSPRRFLPIKKLFPKIEKIENHLFYHVINRMNHKRPFILIINDPIKSAGYAIKKLQKSAKLSIFDFSDDFVEYYRSNTDPRRSICLKNINDYAGGASIVLTVNNHLKKKYGYTNKHIEILKNATNYDNFHRKLYASVDFLEKIKKTGIPLVGYIGVIRDLRIDFNLLDYILKKKGKWQFVFIGDADMAFKEHYASAKNLHLFSPVDYERLPDCLNYFDLTFIPFKQNEHTKGNDLLKLYDFLAMGIPVISTNIGGAEDLKDVIEIADTPLEFIEKMETALNSNNLEAIHRRKSVALNNSWPVRINDFENMVKERLTDSLL